MPKNDSLKVGILKLKNTTPNKKKLKLIYYAKIVIGEDIIKSDNYINLDFDKNANTIYLNNLYNSEIDTATAYVSCSENIQSYTGDKTFFFGNGGLSNPDGIKKLSLNNENSLGKSSCIAYEVEVEIESFSEKEISLILGVEENKIDIKNMSYKYSKIQNCKQELYCIKNYWKDFLRKITSVYTSRIYKYNFKWLDCISNY